MPHTGSLAIAFHLLSLKEYGVHKHAQNGEQHEQDALPDGVAHHHGHAVHGSHRHGPAREEQVEDDHSHHDDDDPDANQDQDANVHKLLLSETQPRLSSKAAERGNFPLSVARSSSRSAGDR